MTKPSSPEPEEELPGSFPEFIERLEAEPGYVAARRAQYEAVLALPLSPESAARQEAARAGLKLLKHYEAKRCATDKMEELKRLMFDEGVLDVVRLNALMDAAIDDLLDAKEPERTELMAKATDLQGDLRRWLAKQAGR